MASFEFDSSGFDDIMDELSRFQVDCPECNRPLEVSLDDVGSTVSCPRCNTNISIESED